MHTIEGYKDSDVYVMHKYIIDNDIDVMINQWGSVDLCYEARKGSLSTLVMCWHQETITKFKYKPSLKGKILSFFHLSDWHSRRWKINVHKHNVNLVDAYVFLTQAFANEYLKLSRGYNEKKIHAISNPLTYSSFYRMDEYESKEQIILFVGRIEEVSKRISYVLKLWGMIQKESVSKKWKLVIVGDGPDLQNAKKIAKEMDLQRISFEGYCNPKPYYEKSSIFVMTSASEGFGMTLLEAQQNGCVPLAMDTYTSLHDIIQDENNGFIIPENNFETYIYRLKELMTNKSLRKEMAENGIGSSKKYSIDMIVDQWEKLFNELKNEK